MSLARLAAVCLLAVAVIVAVLAAAVLVLRLVLYVVEWRRLAAREKAHADQWCRTHRHRQSDGRFRS